MDPRYPGAIDEIINLGAFWDEARLVKHREAIRALVDDIGILYRHAYIYLAAAKNYRDAMDHYYLLSNCEYITVLEKLSLEIIEEILNGRNLVRGKAGQRKLFASAITSRGTINHLENLVSSFPFVFVLRGADGANKRKLIGRIADAALVRGFYVETFCCALDPLQIDHLFIPELEVALVNSMDPHCPELEHVYRNLDVDRFAQSLPQNELQEKEQFAGNYNYAMQKAVSYLARANQQHDELEQYYIPAMRYDEIEKLGQQTLERVRSLVPTAGDDPKE